MGCAQFFETVVEEIRPAGDRLAHQSPQDFTRLSIERLCQPIQRLAFVVPDANSKRFGAAFLGGRLGHLLSVSFRGRRRNTASAGGSVAGRIGASRKQIVPQSAVPAPSSSSTHADPWTIHHRVRPSSAKTYRTFQVLRLPPTAGRQKISFTNKKSLCAFPTLLH